MKIMSNNALWYIKFGQTIENRIQRWTECLRNFVLILLVRGPINLLARIEILSQTVFDTKTSICKTPMGFKCPFLPRYVNSPLVL